MAYVLRPFAFQQHFWSYSKEEVLLQLLFDAFPHKWQLLVSLNPSKLGKFHFFLHDWMIVVAQAELQLGQSKSLVTVLASKRKSCTTLVGEEPGHDPLRWKLHRRRIWYGPTPNNPTNQLTNSWNLTGLEHPKKLCHNIWTSSAKYKTQLHPAMRALQRDYQLPERDSKTMESEERLGRLAMSNSIECHSCARLLSEFINISAVNPGILADLFCVVLLYFVFSTWTCLTKLIECAAAFFVKYDTWGLMPCAARARLKALKVASPAWKTVARCPGVADVDWSGFSSKTSWDASSKRLVFFNTAASVSRLPIITFLSVISSQTLKTIASVKTTEGLMPWWRHGLLGNPCEGKVHVMLNSFCHSAGTKWWNLPNAR